jgi:succinylglutamate desuccinylase
VFVFVAVWLVPRTRAALVLVIRDDIVEATRVMEIVAPPVALTRKVPSIRQNKNRCFVGKFLRVANKSLATMRNNS